MRLIPPLLLMIGLAGCAAPRPWFAPLPPSIASGTHQARQQVTVTSEKQSFSLQTLVRTDDQMILVIALSDAGKGLFKLKWNADQPAPRHRGQPPDPLRTDWVLADLQLALWPLDALRNALPDPFRLEQTGNDRMLSRGDRLLWHSRSEGQNPWTSSLVIRNLQMEYELRIQPLAFAALER